MLVYSEVGLCLRFVVAMTDLSSPQASNPLGNSLDIWCGITVRKICKVFAPPLRPLRKNLFLAALSVVFHYNFYSTLVSLLEVGERKGHSLMF